MATTTPSDKRVPRTIRIDDELWFPFQELCRTVNKSNASTVLRQWIQDTLTDYGIFWAPDIPLAGLDPSPRDIAWYECEMCDTSHRLSGPNASWGCSPAKSRELRLERQHKDAS